MTYISTRGEAASLSFEDVLLAGLARDGGLYVPETWPTLSAEKIASFAGMPFADVAVEVMTPFVGDSIDRPTLKAMAQEAYGRFGHPADEDAGEAVEQQIAWSTVRRLGCHRRCE